jgi:integrase
MATIIKGKNPRKPYTVRYWTDGRQRERSFVTLKEARDFKAKAEHDTRASIFVDPKLGSVSFGEYAAQWIGTRKTVNTRRIYEAVLRLHLVPVYGSQMLRQVANDREGVQRLISSLTVSQQRTAATLLAGVMNEAVKAGRIPSHRLHGLTVAHVNMRAEIIHATYQQLETIAGALPDGYGLTVWLMRGCGLRIAEALAVTPPCVRGDILRISEQILDNGNIAPLKHRKAGDYRDIPLPAYVAEGMNDWQGFEKISRPTYNRAWRTAAAAAGLPTTFTPHTLRHTYASVALHQGIPITEVSRFLGHQSIEITHQVYGYLVPNAFGRTRDAIDAEFRDWSSEGSEKP